MRVIDGEKHLASTQATAQHIFDTSFDAATRREARAWPNKYLDALQSRTVSPAKIATQLVRMKQIRDRRN